MLASGPQQIDRNIGSIAFRIRVHSCPLVVKFRYDSAASAVATFIARDAHFLRRCVRVACRCLNFPQSRSRSDIERARSPIDLYDNSIIHRTGFDEAIWRRIEKETDPAAISRHATMRD